MGPQTICVARRHNEKRLKTGVFLYDRLQVTEAKTISFDGWTLARASGELSRDGKTLRLPQQPLRVLIELLDHAGEVVTRERLVEVLWPKGVVDFDNSLNAVVRKLRAVLGDDSETPRFIETLPRIGYRFVGKVDAQTVAIPDARPAAVPLAEMRRVKRRHIAALILAAVAGVAALAWWSRTPKSELDPATADIAKPDAHRTTNQRAYELYLNGKFHRSRRDINGTPLAVESFNAALKEDPYFADAWAALSETYAGTGISQNVPIDEAMKQARNAALRAIELDPRLAAGHAALGAVFMHYDMDYTAAEKELLAARAADDGYARAWHSLGLLRGYQGRTEEAFEYVGRARELEPTAPLYAVNYANLLYQTRRYGEAIPYLRALIAAQPRFDQARGILIRALVESGDVKAALEQLPLRYASAQVFSDDGLVYARAGRRDEAVREIERLKRRASEGYAMSYELAILYTALGQLDDACAALRRAREDHSQTLGWMKLDPRMDPLRKQPCFSEVERKLYRE
jgi:DNA-binding winged helix-turn-helix (wHTH) protein/Flp pilus assembly protein TadD